MDAHLSQSSDHDLMTAAAGGDLACVGEIYRRRHRGLFRFFFRMTGRPAAAEDLVHEVFVRMIRYRHTYRDGDGFEPWMYRIARNALADQAKKHRLETPAAEGVLESAASGRSSAFDQLAKQQDLALLYRALRELPPDKRELILMSRFEGLTYGQIAEILGAAEGAVKVRVFRAMKEMAAIFEDLRKEKAS